MNNSVYSLTRGKREIGRGGKEKREGGEREKGKMSNVD